MHWSRSALFPLLAALALILAINTPGEVTAGSVPGWPGSNTLHDQEAVATPVDVDESADDDTGLVLGNDELPAFLVALLLFGLLAFGILFLYLYKTQERFYGVFSGLAHSGKPPTVVSVSPFVGAARAGTLAGSTPAPPPVIKGPGIAKVGMPSDEFAVERDGKPLEEATWSVTPATAAAVNPVTGATVHAIPTAPGAFELTATDPSAGTKATVQVAAVAADEGKGSLPFVGTGFGSIAVTILLVVGVLALAFNGNLGSEAVATFFGGLLGYVFGTATSGGGESGGK